LVYRQHWRGATAKKTYFKIIQILDICFKKIQKVFGQMGYTPHMLRVEKTSGQFMH
jgi:hypothetical protein